MALVTVIERLLDAKLLKHQHAAHAKKDLLLQAVLPVTTIKRVGDRTVKLRVHVVVGIEQIKLDTTDVDLPYKCMHLIIYVRHVNNHLVAVLVEYTLYRQAVEVLCVVLGDLLTIHAQALCEIAVTIQEAYATEVHIGVEASLR